MNKKIVIPSLLLAIGALAFTGGQAFEKVKAAEVPAFEIENVFNWIDNQSSFFDACGAHGIREANPADLFSNGIGTKQQLNVEEGKSVSITFQIPDYDHDTRELIPGHVPETKVEDDATLDRPYDIYLNNVTNNYYAIFRIWSGNTLIPGENSSYIQFCESKTSGWETYEGGDISGVFTNGSSFTFTFDTTNYLSVKCDWKEEGEQLVPFHKLGKIGEKETQYLNFMKANFSKAQEIEFWFAHQKMELDTVNEVVIKEINGQSLSVTDNKFDDTVAPIVAPIHESSNDPKYEVGAEYTLKAERYNNDPSTKADFYIRPSSDATCAIDTLIEDTKLFAKLESETEWKELGEMDSSAALIKKISFDKPGIWDLKVEVIDGACNAGYSPILKINVTAGYSIVLDGEVPSTGYVNQELTVPSARAFDASGTEREVKITVEDPLGNIETVVNHKFIPTSVGVYYVTYTSSYTEGGVTYKANKVEREVLITKGGDSSSSSEPISSSLPTSSSMNPSGSSVAPTPTPIPSSNTGLIVGLSIGGGVLVIIAIVAFIIIKKRK